MSSGPVGRLQFHLIETVSYYAIVAAAGHDTTSATISGGMLALLQNPDQQ